MKKIIVLTPLLALAALAPLRASAGLNPGLYDLVVPRHGVFQQICLLPSLGWYSFTFPNLGGHWLNTKADTNIFGTDNASQDVGNVSVVVNRQGTSATWTEWTSNLSFFNIVEPLQVQFISSSC